MVKKTRQLGQFFAGNHLIIFIHYPGKIMLFINKKTYLSSIIVITGLFLSGCSEQETNTPTHQVEAAVTVTEDKITQLQKEAQAGDPDAQYNLAYLYENGLGVPKNEARALELYQQAADQGHSAAKSNLNAMSSSK